MLETLEVKTESSHYDILIEKGLILNGQLPLDTYGTDSGRWCLITDEHVAALYPQVINKCVNESAEVIILTPGEETKNLRQVERVMEKLAALRFTRQEGLIALGGGVVGDITGFCASIYMRGIQWLQIPTTLLAQVDSSVGGKTGVNLTQGKNLVGSFYQPKAVWIDPLFHNTLPDREFWGGCSEVVKYGIIEGPLFQQWLKENWTAIMAKESDTMTRLIGKCLTSKKAIVSQDEREAGARKKLNVGHTAGHAIEKLARYKVTHGEALREGLLFELALATRIGWVTTEKAQHLSELIKGIPASGSVPAYSIHEMVQAMQLDKKNRGKRISFVLPKENNEIEEIQMELQQVMDIME